MHKDEMNVDIMCHVSTSVDGMIYVMQVKICADKVSHKSGSQDNKMRLQFSYL